MTVFNKQNEDTKSPALVKSDQDIKNEYLDWQNNERNTITTSSRTPPNHRSSSAELAEKEAQEVIRDLLVLNQLSSSSSRNSRDILKKQTGSIYSSHSLDPRVSSPLGVIHHPAFRNTYSTVCIGWLVELLL